MSHLDSQRQPCYYASSNAGSGNDKAAARNQQMSNKNETILKLVAELKASAIDGLSIDISEKPDGSVSVIFRQPSAENDLDLPTEIDCNGHKLWKNKDGQIHRDGDLPAIEYADGEKRYYKDGQLHRDGDLPAVESTNGQKEYYKNGKRHRDGDLPAIEHADGVKYYYKNGHIHRDDDLPAVELIDGTKKFLKDGKLHREGDKPAIIWADGSKVYFKNGKYHRDGDLPAVIKKDKYEYWVDGKHILTVNHNDGVIEI